MKVLKRLSQAAVLLALVFAIAAGATVYNVRQSSEEVRAAFVKVTSAFRQKTPPLIDDLLQSSALQDSEREQLESLSKTFGSFPTAPDLQRDTQRFSTALKGLRTVLVEMAANEEISSLPSFAQLKGLSYGQNDLSQLFYAYNQQVLVWNRRDRSDLGRLVASTLRLEKILMVNPDGSTEFSTTIKF